MTTPRTLGNVVTLGDVVTLLQLSPVSKRSNELAAEHHRRTEAPAELFSRLVREVDAGRALIEQSGPRDRQLAALDALDLARAVLVDGRDLFASCACGAIELRDGVGYVPAGDELVHDVGACVRIDQAGEQL